MPVLLEIVALTVMGTITLSVASVPFARSNRYGRTAISSVTHFAETLIMDASRIILTHWPTLGIPSRLLEIPDSPGYTVKQLLDLAHAMSVRDRKLTTTSTDVKLPPQGGKE